VILLLVWIVLGATCVYAVSISYCSPSSILDRTTVYVGGSGPGNYTKIQDALDAISDGDTVFVYDEASPYLENLMIEKPVNLVGENRDTTILDGNGKLDVIFISNVEGVMIHGFTIQHSGVLWLNHGINVQSSHTMVFDNIIRQNINGIGVYNDYNFISDNVIEDNADKGVSLMSHYSNITRNTISNNFGGLILAFSSNNMVVDNVFINNGVVLWGYSYPNVLLNNTVNAKPLVFLEDESNYVVLEDAGQILLMNCDNITVENKDVSHGSIGITLFNTHNSRIVDNVVSSNAWYGIFLSQSTGNNLSGNRVVGCTDGIVLESSDENSLLWNQVQSNTNSGIYLFFSDNNTISYNIIEKNGGRKWIESREGLRLENSSDTVIYHNNFLRNGWDAYLSGPCTRNIWDGNYWNRPRLFPKPIIHRTADQVLMRFDFDWHPAREPYDIGGII
jgi:parallel beta-helix repeat protein